MSKENEKEVVSLEKLLTKNSGKTTNTWDLEKLRKLATEIGKLKEQAEGKDWYEKWLSST